MDASLHALFAEPDVVVEVFGDVALCRLADPWAPGAAPSFAVHFEPAWVSPELRTVLRARSAASVTGRCPGCDAVRDVPAEAKTLTGPQLFVDMPLEHGEDCPYSDFMVRLLRDRDCPGLEPPDLDLSDEALAPLHARLEQIVQEASRAQASADASPLTRLA